MKLVEFHPFWVNPDQVIYIHKLDKVTRIFLHGGHYIDVPESDRTVVYRLTGDTSYAN